MNDFSGSGGTTSKQQASTPWLNTLLSSLLENNREVAMSDDSQLHALNVGYDLDLSGYSFEHAPPGLFRPEALVFESSDLNTLMDLFPWIEDEVHDPGPRLFAFCLQELPSRVHWPNKLRVANVPYVLEGCGQVLDSDHDCCCFGKLTTKFKPGSVPVPSSVLERWGLELDPSESDDLTLLEQMRGRAGDAMYWEPSNDPDDPAFPDCERCEGFGIVDSPAGAWAVYLLID